MIELRWVEKYYGIEGCVITLQYRTRSFRASPPFNSGFEGWGAWQDVPTVKGEEADEKR